VFENNPQRVRAGEFSLRSRPSRIGRNPVLLLILDVIARVLGSSDDFLGDDLDAVDTLATKGS
jgi:hypothetical protein